LHELAVTENILKIAVEHGQRAGAGRITAIHLVIGGLSGFVDDAIQFNFDLLTPGTLAEGAQLHFQRIPARLRCRQCDTVFEPDGIDWRCPECDALAGEVIAGKEFFVESIEIV